MDQAELETVLVQLGCPAHKSREMAAQLNKRAHQIAVERGQSYDDALYYLVELMSQGWAAKGSEGEQG